MRATLAGSKALVQRGWHSFAPRCSVPAARGRFSSEALDSHAADPFAGPVATVVRHPAAVTEPFGVVPPDDVAPGAKFAVISLSGTQYKVAEDDVVVTNLIHGHKVGDVMEVDDVLLVGGRDNTVVGRPRVEGAKVPGGGGRTGFGAP